jgi:hypothetical protein
VRSLTPLFFLSGLVIGAIAVSRRMAAAKRRRVEAVDDDSAALPTAAALPLCDRDVPGRIECTSPTEGVGIMAFGDVSGCYVGRLAGVYLLLLGPVDRVRGALPDLPTTIPPGALVCRFGCSERLRERMAEHTRGYGRLPGVQLRVAYFTAIDRACVFQAESALKRALGLAGAIEVQLPGHRELIALQPSQLKACRAVFAAVQNEFTDDKDTTSTRMQAVKARLASCEALLQEKSEALLDARRTLHHLLALLPTHPATIGA